MNRVQIRGFVPCAPVAALFSGALLHANVQGHASADGKHPSTGLRYGSAARDGATESAIRLAAVPSVNLNRMKTCRPRPQARGLIEERALPSSPPAIVCCYVSDAAVSEYKRNSSEFIEKIADSSTTRSERCGRCSLLPYAGLQFRRWSHDRSEPCASMQSRIRRKGMLLHAV